ncbi:chitobiase/beta-hexosaminidase C-terminal domain-containing protein [Desulfurispira natronophila]|uniref:Bacterial repeat domain-containing protein n=1 Tax=Desulfurispira natronophila TaxID=682562 RepID=A0A7W7Y4P1_9BACT|nr:chitobiase/beta-hexosaminidase C-terminal domain-containing protein [Desulfurispira natronophila]MBB5022013.1 hypothetical protein [Desulfurispira natronophila]
MKKLRILLISIMTAALVVGCGGDSGGSTETYKLTLAQPVGGNINYQFKYTTECGDYCWNVPKGGQVTLEAVAAQGYEFDEWSGINCDLRECTFNMNSNRIVSVTFSELASTDTGDPDSGTPGGDDPITVAAPVLSPNGGTFADAPSVTITSGTDGAVIYYTIDGNTPTGSSTQYSDAITVTTTQTIKAVAIKDGESSSVVEATFTIETSGGDTSYSDGAFTAPILVAVGTTSGKVGTSADSAQDSYYRFTTDAAGSYNMTVSNIVDPAELYLYLYEEGVNSESGFMERIPFRLGDGIGRDSLYATLNHELAASTSYVLRVQNSSNAANVTYDLDIEYAGSWQYVGDAGFNGTEALNVQMALRSSGQPYVVFRDAGNGSRTKVMTYAGASWENVGGFASSEASYNQRIAIDPSDNRPVVSYNEVIDSKQYTRVKKFNGTEWENLSSSALHGVYSAMAFDGNGNLHVVYDDYSVSDGTFTPGSNGELTVKKLDSENWLSVGSERFSDRRAVHMQLAFDGDNAAHVAFVDYITSQGDKITVMKFDGTDWTVLGDKRQFAGGTPDLAFHPVTDELYLVKDGNMRVYRYADSQWHSVGGDADIVSTANATNIAFAPDGALYAAYGAGANYALKANVMQFDGAAWRVVGERDFSQDEGRYVSLQIGSDGLPMVAFADKGNELINSISVMSLGEVSGSTPPSGGDYDLFVGIEDELTETDPEKWYEFAVEAGKTYLVQWEDIFDRSTESTYSGDVEVSVFDGSDNYFPYFSSQSATDSSGLFEKRDSGYVISNYIKPLGNSVLRIKVNTWNNSAYAYGTFALRVIEVTD